MQVDVFLLPHRDLSVQSFSARGEAPYLSAHEELRAAVALAIGNLTQQEHSAPYARCAVTIVCYTGKKKQDGRYRPERVHTLHYCLDPIYRALLDSEVIATMEAIDSIRVVLRREQEHEGFRIIVEELALPQRAREAVTSVKT